MRYFNLYSNIIISKGVNRILITDLQRNTSEIYPLELNEIIEELNNVSIEELFKDFDLESQVVLQEYLDLLLDKEYGFITLNQKDSNFPNLSTEYNEASEISDLFIELDDFSVLEKTLNSVELLNMKFITIFCERYLSIEEMIKIDKYFIGSSLIGFQIYSPFHDEINKLTLEHLNQKTLRIFNLVLFNCFKKPKVVKSNFKFQIEFTRKQIVRESCGKVSLNYFETNIIKVLESINHNSCLHKKISVDKLGNIKNCPSMQQSFGNINDTTLEEALNHPDFKKYWNVNKDMIEVCKDCEFRHICTDCRAYTERNVFEEALDLSKPLKCGYNPYTTEWSEWSTNPLKEKAIEYYGMQELVKKNNF